MDRKNILWIMTDQQKYDALSCLSGPPHMTENLDGLALDAVLFENAYTPCPVCGPARASLKTGLYPPETGVVKNWVGFKDGFDFLPHMLLLAGYETGLAGKLHFYPAERDYGFEKRWLSDAPYSTYSDDPDHSEYVKWLREIYEKKGKGDPVELFNKDEESYDEDLKRFILGSAFRENGEHETEWTRDRTIEFLDNRDRNRPFFFYCSFFGPHQPYEPPEPYASWISKDEIRLPDSYYTDYKKGCPVFERNARSVYDHVRASMDEDDCKEAVAKYYGQVRMIDESIGAILRYLKDHGLYDDTLIIFSSDHGDHLAEHGLFFKGQMYDSCAKVPLIIRKPDGCKGVRCQKIVNTIDLYLTILDYAGVSDSNNGVSSVSLLPLLDGDGDGWTDESYSIIGGDPSCAMSMLRSSRYKLIRHPDPDCTAVYEMYDLEADPAEICDIWPESKDDAAARDMKEKLDRWSEKQISLY